LPRRVLQSTSLLLTFALLEPLAWKAHLLVRQLEWKVRWGYSVPQGRTVSRERSGQREPPVSRKLALVVPAVRLQPREHQEHVVRRVMGVQALPEADDEEMFGAQQVARARVSAEWV